MITCKNCDKAFDEDTVAILKKVSFAGTNTFN